MQISYFAAKGGLPGDACFGSRVRALWRAGSMRYRPGSIRDRDDPRHARGKGSLLLKNRTCLKRFAAPEALPQMLPLASGDTYCTGQNDHVDGGLDLAAVGAAPYAEPKGLCQHGGGRFSGEARI